MSDSDEDPEITSGLKKGWAIASEERDWKYRLSIYYVKPQDSGTFTCATPRGITNSLTLQVAAVHCDPISVSGPHLTVRVEGTRLGHTAIFQCPMGFKVNGAANLTCQASVGTLTNLILMLIFYLVGTVKMKIKLLEMPNMYYSKLRVEMRMKLKLMNDDGGAVSFSEHELTAQ
ncbi:hypothetical protein MTP99_013915 [Tenebrio molitor]|nr:hypothetical protein MTP99_013915 [Tenebrio molitor]